MTFSFQLSVQRQEDSMGVWQWICWLSTFHLFRTKPQASLVSEQDNKTFFKNHLSYRILSNSQQIQESQYVTYALRAASIKQVQFTKDILKS